MSYKKELQDLIVSLRNNHLRPADALLTNNEDQFEWRQRFDRWAEIIDFAINHPDEFKANLEVD